MENLTQYQNYEQYKTAVDTVLNRTVEDFVITGYLLKKGRDTDILKDSGYANVNEFAMKEYHLDATQVSRYIRINDKFAEGGYSERLQEQYKGFGYAKLAIMLTLPETINEELSPAFSKTEILAVKEEIENEQKKTDIEVILEGEKEEQQELNNLQKALHQLFDDEPALFLSLYDAAKGGANLETIQGILAPDGEKLYSVRIQGCGRIMLLLKDSEQKVIAHKVRENEKEFFDWEEIQQYIKDLETEQDAKERWTELYKKEFQEQKQEIAPVQKPGKEKKPKPRKESKVKKAKLPEEQKKPDKKEPKSPETLNTEEIEGQMEITKDMPEYCPADTNQAKQEREAEPEKEPEEPVQAPQPPEPQKLAEEIECHYGSRKQYIDHLTEYGAALYMAASMVNMKHMLLNDPKYWEAWLKTEVDDNGEEIEVVG